MSNLMDGLRTHRWAKRSVAAALSATVLVALTFVPTTVGAANSWQVGVGAETKDKGIQLAYYYSDNITVNVGDTVNFNFQTGEIHSVTFFDGSDSGVRAAGAPAFSKTFGAPGDYAYFCVIHTFMKGVVHVQAANSPYPHTQQEYDHQSLVEQTKSFAEGRQLQAQGLAAAAQGDGKNITAGIGAAHPEDNGSVFVLRFLKTAQQIKVGDTVTWTNLDPEAPHSITFNENYTDPFQALFPDGLDFAGPPGHATISDPAQPVNSGFLWAAPFPGLPPPAYVGTVFQATFTQPGTYQYYCELHDDLGMVGTITVSR